MIKFMLRCTHCETEFEGWFRDCATYDEQAAAKAISCAACGSSSVGKAIMAPNVIRGRTRERAANTTEQTSDTGREAALRRAGEMALQREMALRIRSYVESRCENVGDRFYEEAKNIHSGEAKQRGIYGNATPDEAVQLREEGIPVCSILWEPNSDS